MILHLPVTLEKASAFVLVVRTMNMQSPDKLPLPPQLGVPFVSPDPSDDTDNVSYTEDTVLKIGLALLQLTNGGSPNRIWEQTSRQESTSRRFS